jgi:L-ascorbate metabolism protein UlaG (beta-lactamase superfamily)
MANLSITWLGHGGVLYRTPQDTHLWVDRWTGGPTYPDALRDAERVDVVAPTHGHFDHVGENCQDVADLVQGHDGAVVVCGHEMSIFLAGRGIDAIGMNKGGTVEAGGVSLTMVQAVHPGGATLGEGDGQVTRDLGSWGWVFGFEDGTVVYHSGDTDLFGDMNLVRERFAPSIAVLPIGGHYTMGPRDAARAVDMLGVSTVIPVHYGTFPVLTGTPDELRQDTSAEVVALEPGETWELPA